MPPNRRCRRDQEQGAGVSIRRRKRTLAGPVRGESRLANDARREALRDARFAGRCAAPPAPGRRESRYPCRLEARFLGVGRPIHREGVPWVMCCRLWSRGRVARRISPSLRTPPQPRVMGHEARSSGEFHGYLGCSPRAVRFPQLEVAGSRIQPVQRRGRVTSPSMRGESRPAPSGPPSSPEVMAADECA